MKTRYTTMTRNDVREIKDGVLEQLSEWAADHGLTVEYRGATFDPSGVANLKLQISLASGDPSAVPASDEAIAFRQLCRVYGFEESDLGRLFNVLGTTYQIIGLKSRASKKPILLRNTEDGTRVVAPVDWVQQAVRRSAA